MTKPVAEEPVISIITEPRATLERLQTTTNTLGSASGALREVLRPLDRQTLEGEQDRLSEYGRSQPTGWSRPYRYVIKRELAETKAGERYWKYHATVPPEELSGVGF